MSGLSFQGWGMHSMPGGSFPGCGIHSVPGVSLTPRPAGRDASRAFASGDFTPAGLVDDVSGLSPPELLSIHSWLSFYRDNYEPVGRFTGRGGLTQGVHSPRS